MKSRSLILATVFSSLLAGLAHAAEDRGAAGPIGPAERATLDVPVGTEAHVQGKIIRAEDAGCKGLDGQYVLEISRVNGKDLATKGIFRFRSAEGLAPKIAGDVFSLHELKTGKIADEIPEDQVVALEKAYLGRPVEFVASELEAVPAKQDGKSLPSVLLLSKCLKAP